MVVRYRNQDFIDKISKRIEKIRLEKGITQEDIADRTGFTIKQVWKITSGTSNIGVSTLEAVANSIGVHPKELLDFEFELTKYPPTRKERKGK